MSSIRRLQRAELEHESLKRLNSARQIRQMFQSHEPPALCEALTEAGVKLPLREEFRLVDERRKAELGVEILEASADVPTAPISSFTKPYMDYRKVPESLRDRTRFTSFYEMHPAGGGGWDDERLTSFIWMVKDIVPQRYDFESAKHWSSKRMKAIVGRLPQQNESSKVFGRISSARKAAEMVRQKMEGLSFDEPTPKELELLASNGLVLSDEQGRRRADPAAIADTHDLASLQKEGISQERLGQIRMREESKEFLSKSYEPDSGGISAFEMSDFRYCTLEGLKGIRLKQRERIIEAIREVDDRGILYERILELESEGIPMRSIGNQGSQEGGEFFESIVLKRALTWNRNQLSDIQMIQASKSGVDTGFLTGDGLMPHYSPGYDFSTDSPLHRTGLVMGVESGSPLVHEYAHLDDFMFNRMDSGKYSWKSFITELVAYSEGTFYRNEPERIGWADVKRKMIGKSYLGGHEDEDGYDEAVEKMGRCCDVVGKMFDSGMSKDVLKSTLMSTNNFEDILAWDRVFDDRPDSVGDRKALDAELSSIGLKRSIR